jgi:hypothetical protein
MLCLSYPGTPQGGTNPPPEGAPPSVRLSTIKEQTWDKICWPGTNNAQKVA